MTVYAFGKYYSASREFLDPLYVMPLFPPKTLQRLSNVERAFLVMSKLAACLLETTMHAIARKLEHVLFLRSGVALRFECRSRGQPIIVL